MELLVLGGSYFLGKHFVQQAQAAHTLTVLNRGSRPLRLDGVEEIVGDRHDAASFQKLAGRSFDAVVDFCAYQEGDIAFVFEQLKGRFDQYIFISTCDVYKHGLGEVLDESAPFEDVRYAGESGAYIAGKVALERELALLAEEHAASYTVFRPSFIYGPDNYAPREGMYFHWIREAGQILHPTDATGEFQMVYVEDAARAVLCALGNQKSYGRAYNLTPEPYITYESFAQALAAASPIPFSLAEVDVQTIVERQIPLPFPLLKEESNRYDGGRALELIESYTTLEDGLRGCMQ